MGGGPRARAAAATRLGLAALAELPRVGERRLATIQMRAVAAGMSLAEVAALEPCALVRRFGLPAAAAAHLEREGARHAARCRALLTALAASGVILCRPGDPGYPRRWTERLSQPPPFAYAHGAAALLRRPVLALLSSRTVDEAAIAGAARIAGRAAAGGFAVAVGGMKSTHRIAATMARAAGAPRLVVLDRGMLDAFGGRFDLDPFGFGPDRPSFDPRTTLALSVCRPRDHATPRSGRRRDELVAALGDLVVALHARPGGEVERICLDALARGRRVASWGGESTRLLAAGAEALVC